MPKMKSQRGAAKRFKLTASGKLKRRKAFASHILTKKSRKRKRNLRQVGYIVNEDLSRVKRMIVV
jgi:large subunit ribosomal protein L35